MEGTAFVSPTFATFDELFDSFFLANVETIKIIAQLKAII
jgi:hypothetical protein